MPQAIAVEAVYWPCSWHQDAALLHGRLTYDGGQAGQPMTYITVTGPDHTFDGPKRVSPSIAAWDNGDPVKLAEIHPGIQTRQAFLRISIIPAAISEEFRPPMAITARIFGHCYLIGKNFSGNIAVPSDTSLI